jgi:hypothetical protein
MFEESTSALAKRLLRWLLYIALLVALPELATRARDLFGGPRHHGLKWSDNIYDRRGSQSCKFADKLLPHPYLGYVFSVGRPCSEPEAHAPGFISREFPAARRSDAFVVLVSGGSVADLCTRPDDDGKPPLESALNARFRAPKGDRFLVLNGAVGGWKEPQARFLFEMYGHIADGWVTLEGYNELNVARTQLAFDFPPAAFLQMNPLYENDLDVVGGTAALDRVHRTILGSFLLRHSHFVHALFLAARARIERRTAAGDSATHQLFSGGSWERNLDTWRRHLDGIHRDARAAGVLDAVFLQPVPALGKPLTDEERRVVGDLSYGADYRRAVAALPDVHSLLDAFTGIDRTLYVDDIHYRDEGCRIVTEAMAGELGRAWHLAPRQ